MHDARSVVGRAVDVLALVALEEVVLNSVLVPVVGGPTHRSDHLRAEGWGGEAGGGNGNTHEYTHTCLRTCTSMMIHVHGMLDTNFSNCIAWKYIYCTCMIE